MWAFGCFGYELAAGEPLNWKIRQPAKLVRQITERDAPEIPARWSDAYRDFVRVCLRRRPEDRFNFSQLLEHEFLANIDVDRCKQAWIRDLKSYNER